MYLTKKPFVAICNAAILCVSVVTVGGIQAEAQEPTVVREVLRPLDGNDLSGWTTWLESSGHQDRDGTFAVDDGVLHISGKGRGYLATETAFQDYHLSVEYKWGKRTDGSKYVRNSGVLLHGIGPHGGRDGVWMTSIECQLAQGCEGDAIVIRGHGKSGAEIPATVSSETRLAEDRRTRWQRGGKERVYSGKQFWWSNHQAGFEELLDTRGKDDVASRLGEWTRVECVCDGDRITIKINGTTVNELYNVYPSAGKILLQNEGNEIYFRDLELRPLPRNR